LNEDEINEIKLGKQLDKKAELKRKQDKEEIKEFTMLKPIVKADEKSQAKKKAT